MDHFFMRQDDEKTSQNPLIVMVDEETNEKFARSPEKKGVGEEGEICWAIKECADELKLWGHTGGSDQRLILKCDGESSMKAFRDILARFHGGVVIPARPAKGESQSNGTVEGAGRVARDFARVLKEQIEKKANMNHSS